MKSSIRLHVTGKTEYGKSYWVKNTLLPLFKKFKPTIVFDRKGEYGGKRAKDVPEKWQTFEGFNDFWDEMRSRGGQMKKDVYVITCKSDQDYLKGFAKLYRMTNDNLKTGVPLSIVIDEAHDLLQSRDFTDTKRILVQLARHGRHEGLGITLISQRTLDVPTDIRSQLTGYVSFYQALNNDIEALKKDGYPEAEKLLALDKFEYLSFGEIPKHLNKIEQKAVTI